MVMKKITFSANQGDVELARELASEQKTTLSELFRVWLRETAERQMKVRDLRDLMSRLRHVNAGLKFTRDEMNERR
jgi:hypothetical protein